MKNNQPLLKQRYNVIVEQLVGYESGIKPYNEKAFMQLLIEWEIAFDELSSFFELSESEVSQGFNFKKARNVA